MSKFDYEKGDIQIAKCQCAFCVFNREESPQSCVKYKEKPKEVLLNEVKCPFAKDNLPTPWQE